jgi:hypothetical protein
MTIILLPCHDLEYVSEWSICVSPVHVETSVSGRKVRDPYLIGCYDVDLES